MLKMNHNNNNQSSAEEEKGPLVVDTNNTTANNADNLDAIADDMPQQRDLLSNDIKQSTPNNLNTSPIITTDGIDDNTTDGSSSMMSTKKENDVLNVDTVSLFIKFECYKYFLYSSGTLVVRSVEVVALFKIDIHILWVIGIQGGQSLFGSFGDGKFLFHWVFV